MRPPPGHPTTPRAGGFVLDCIRAGHKLGKVDCAIRIATDTLLLVAQHANASGRDVEKTRRIAAHIGYPRARCHRCPRARRAACRRGPSTTAFPAVSPLRLRQQVDGGGTVGDVTAVTVHDSHSRPTSCLPRINHSRGVCRRWRCRIRSVMASCGGSDCGGGVESGGGGKCELVKVQYFPATESHTGYHWLK